ncbi:hypothetical protein SM139_1746 [Stenotrophomonas maltophilia]|nr:hypothetical protein SM139_1746 [Stenotrophomonas maltophilia]
MLRKRRLEMIGHAQQAQQLHFQGGLLADFADHGSLHRFHPVDFAAGQAPMPALRIASALDQQDAAVGITDDGAASNAGNLQFSHGGE